jgi:ACS family D-galactonate transporter-like MFS transporter
MSVHASLDEKRTYVRWFPILALVIIATFLNYLDRTVGQTVAGPLINEEFKLTTSQTNWWFLAFSWTYALAQIPGGIFLDRFGTRWTYCVALIGWSLVTFAFGFVEGFVALFVLRMLLGIFEAPCFPANSKVLAIWFPQNERARANGVYAIGQYAGIGLLTAPLYWITASFGWRTLFFIMGGIGIIFGIVWYILYRDPGEAAVSKNERDHIQAGGGLEADGERVPFSWKNLAYLLRRRQVIGASLGQFAGNSGFVFFVTWFPTYLTNDRHMEFLKSGILPLLTSGAALAGVLLGGVLSDLLLKATGSANFARKMPVVGGLFLMATILAANYVPVEDNVTVIAILSIAFFGQGLTNLGWTLITDVAPKKLIGLTGGIFNFIANLAGISTLSVVVYFYNATHSFYAPLAYISVVALLGVCSYLFILGDVKRLPEPD